MTIDAPLVELTDVTFRYPKTQSSFTLFVPTFVVQPGEILAITGRSGAGKTTLLHLIAGLLAPQQGTVTTGAPWAHIPQELALFDVLTALENVTLPLHVAGVDESMRVARARLALASVGLDRHERQRPPQLSGGQCQRVAIARALAQQSPLLLADEPTAQLDSTSAKNVMDLIHEIGHEGKRGAIVTTHDPLVVARADRVFEIRDGTIHERDT